MSVRSVTFRSGRPATSRWTPPRAAAVLIAVCALVGCAPAAEPVSAPAHTHPPADWARRCTDWDKWDTPGPPFRIFGNSYYVGTCGIAAILVTGDAGHVLIDGGTEAGAALIQANIEALGFAIRDVKLVLHSHEHLDHVGGLARLQQVSGARLLASPAAAPVLQSGIASGDDPQAGMHPAFPPARVDGLVRPGTPVTLGRLRLTPVATPGHTSGALTWQWQDCEGARCLSLVYADSLSPVSSERYRFSDHPAYLEAYRASLRSVAALDCAILLTPHPSASGMRDRLGAPAGLVDPGACRAFAGAVTGRLDERLATEARSRP